MEDSLPAGSSSPSAGGNRSNSLPPPSVPPHSLAAFGLFLRLPGYAEVLLRDKKKAQCLLRLVLGVTDDGEGGMYQWLACQTIWGITHEFCNFVVSLACSTFPIWYLFTGQNVCERKWVKILN